MRQQLEDLIGDGVAHGLPVHVITDQVLKVVRDQVEANAGEGYGGELTLAPIVLERLTA